MTTVLKQRIHDAVEAYRAIQSFTADVDRIRSLADSWNAPSEYDPTVGNAPTNLSKRVKATVKRY